MNGIATTVSTNWEQDVEKWCGRGKTEWITKLNCLLSGYQSGFDPSAVTVTPKTKMSFAMLRMMIEWTSFQKL